MSWWAIGTPGVAARTIMSAQHVDELIPQIQGGEVAVPVEAVGEYTIALNGNAAVKKGASPAEDMASIRATRNALLAGSDKYMLPDYPIAEAERSAWATYRQSLRDITEDQPAATSATIEWPSPVPAPPQP